jgi:hypothetical protein
LNQIGQGKRGDQRELDSNFLCSEEAFESGSNVDLAQEADWNKIDAGESGQVIEQFSKHVSMFVSSTEWTVESLEVDQVAVATWNEFIKEETNSDNDQWCQ